MTETNPWKTLSSKVVYKNAWISVREDQVIRPDGAPGIYGVVDTRIATGVVALTPEREVYLVGQYRYPTDCYSWEIIEGGTDAEESPLDAAKRELQEEAGLVAEHWDVLAADLHLSNCISSERAVLYLATGLRHVPASPEGTEVLKLSLLPLERCVEMVVGGEISDAMSVMGLLLADRQLNSPTK